MPDPVSSLGRSEKHRRGGLVRWGGQMMAARAGDPALRAADDRLDWRWIAALYVLPWIPLGPLVVIVGSSIGYYRLRKSRPVSATRLNRHAFVAFGLAVAFVVARRVLT